jgi:hypothetical protein
MKLELIASPISVMNSRHLILGIPTQGGPTRCGRYVRSSRKETV